METIGLRELNQNPSKAVARVRAGAAIVVTDRGKPVLRMIPEIDQMSALQRAVMAGEAQPAVSTEMPELMPELSDLGLDLGELLIADRDKERSR